MLTISSFLNVKRRWFSIVSPIIMPLFSCTGGVTLSSLYLSGEFSVPLKALSMNWMRRYIHGKLDTWYSIEPFPLNCAIYSCIWINFMLKVLYGSSDLSNDPLLADKCFSEIHSIEPKGTHLDDGCRWWCQCHICWYGMPEFLADPPSSYCAPFDTFSC